MELRSSAALIRTGSSISGRMQQPQQTAAAKQQQIPANSGSIEHVVNHTYPPRSVFEAKKEEQNTVVSNCKESLIQPSCSFEGEDPVTNHNTVATCTNIWYGKRPV